MIRGIRAVLVLTTCALLGGATELRAQLPADYLARGIASYQALSFDSAAGWLRRALTPPLMDGLAPAEQVRALTYLGATEFFRTRRDTAAAVFERVLRLDPGARPDPVVFPPDVTRLFDEVRSRFPIVAIHAAGDVTLDRDHRSYPVTLVPSTPHDVVVTLDRADGRVTDTLYAGPVGDSMTVDWRALDRAGGRLPDGKYWVTATSLTTGPRGCEVRLPVEVASRAADTLLTPSPPDSATLRPERASAGTGGGALLRGLLFAGAALALPTLGSDAAAGGPRAIAVGLGVAGLLGIVLYRPGQPIPENVAANAMVRARWERQAAEVAAENDARRRAILSRVRAAPWQVVGCGAT